MISKCLSCGYAHHEIELNCSKCGSFYTEIIDDTQPPKRTQEKALNVTEKVIDQPKILNGVPHD